MNLLLFTLTNHLNHHFEWIFANKTEVKIDTNPSRNMVIMTLCLITGTTYPNIQNGTENKQTCMKVTQKM